MNGGQSLSEAERAHYEWQTWSPGFDVEGQQRLKAARVLVSRVGGVGGAAAQQLAMAGIGRIVLAHAGDLRAGDLNRQGLMAFSGLGRPRAQQAAQRLRDLNPYIEVEAVAENVNEDNVERLVAEVDLVVGAAPLFSERLLLNRAAVRQGKPLVDCAMYDLDVQVTTVLPGRPPCLACLVPEPPPAWRRQFPVFGAVATVAGALGAMEAIKVLAGLGQPLTGRLLLGDLRTMTFRPMMVWPRPDCPVCAGTKGE